MQSPVGGGCRLGGEALLMGRAPALGKETADEGLERGFLPRPQDCPRSCWSLYLRF